MSMRESRINWPRFFKPVCVLSILLGVLWGWGFFLLPDDNLIGLIAYGVGTLCFLLGGIFGLMGRPRSLVPLLDFVALAASMLALWKVGLGWREFAGVAVAALYLVCCNATTIIGDGDSNEEPDYSELHPYWENMEKVKQQMEQARAEQEKRAEENSGE